MRLVCSYVDDVLVEILINGARALLRRVLGGQAERWCWASHFEASVVRRSGDDWKRSRSYCKRSSHRVRRLEYRILLLP